MSDLEETSEIMPTSLAFQRTQSPRSAMPPSRSHRGPLPLNPYLTAFLFYLITTISDPLSLSLPVTCCNSFNLQASKISKHSRQTYSQKPLLIGMSQRLFLAHAGWSYSKGPCCLQWGKTVRQWLLEPSGKGKLRVKPPVSHS